MASGKDDTTEGGLIKTPPGQAVQRAIAPRPTG